jgi:hypothetical protein
MSRLLTMVILAGGFALGAWYGHSNAPVTAKVASMSTPATMQLTTHPDAAPLASSEMSGLRTLIREELALAKKDSATPVVPTQVEAPPSPEILTQRHNALAEIDGLTAGGVWGNEQRVRFRNDLRVLDAGQRKHAMQELMAALNSGTIKVHGGPPL